MPFISGGGGSGLPLTGGTLTGALTLHPAAAVQPLEIISGDNGTTGNNAVTVSNAAADTLLEIDDAGDVTFDSHDATTQWKARIDGAERMRLTDSYLTFGIQNQQVVVVDDGVNKVFVLQQFGAAADSAYLGAGDFQLWLDKTNGAPKLMVKAKQADGTVVTAAVALA